MNTLLICLCIGQIVCAFLLAMIGYHAIQDREEAEVAIYCMEKYMEGHGLEVPSTEELADYINSLAKKENA